MFTAEIQTRTKHVTLQDDPLWERQNRRLCNVFWDMPPCNTFSFSSCFRGTCRYRLQKSVWSYEAHPWLLPDSSCFLCDVLLDPEDGGNMLLRTVDTVFCPRIGVLVTIALRTQNPSSKSFYYVACSQTAEPEMDGAEATKAWYVTLCRIWVTGPQW
jgi:hypothetical protein